MTKYVTNCCGKFKISVYAFRRYAKIFDVQMVRGSWPTDDYLVAMCNNECAAEKGGSVEAGVDAMHKVVTVNM